MSDLNKIMKTQRQMAWRRAEGELESMLVTFLDNEGQCQNLRDAIDKFYADVQLNGLLD